MQNEITPSSRLRLPVQAAPVDRTLGPGALSGGPGVEAALFGFDLPSWEDLKGWGEKYIPTAIDLATKYGPKILSAL
jgi:hypothetical protein